MSGRSEDGNEQEPDGFSYVQNVPAFRSAYLLDGRRVTLADLVKAGLLEPGSALSYERKSIGWRHSGVVTSTGNIRFADGQEFRSPSRAAAVAADVSAVDGWHAWIVDSSGRSLDALRQDLLSRVASQESDQGPLLEQTEAHPTPQDRYELLKQARIQAETGNPICMPVRDLLSKWNASARGYLVNQRIDADLANHGLITSPNFRAVTLETTVELITPTTEPASGGKSGTLEIDGETSDIGLTIGNLASALGGVVSIHPNATFEDAITQMLLNDYSQLPVLSGPHTVRGAVTWRSIAKARHAKPAAILGDAIVPCQEVSYDRDLIDVLPILEEHDFVVVRDQKNSVAGIITTTDIAQAYGELASPFLLIGELDQMLRRTLSRIYPLDDIVRWCDPDGSRGLSSFDDLDMGDYQHVLENPDRWRSLEWPLDRVVFIKRLAELREIRNDVMHFNQDAVPPGGINKLRNMLNMLREFEI